MTDTATTNDAPTTDPTATDTPPEEWSVTAASLIRREL